MEPSVSDGYNSASARRGCVLVYWRVRPADKPECTKERFMRITTVLGIVLVVLGVVSLAYQGITYTTHKKVVDLDPIQATKEEHKTIPLPPIVGAVALAGGLLVLITDRKIT